MFGSRTNEGARKVRRAGSNDVEAIISFEADVMNLRNLRLYGRPLDHAAALSEVQANEYFLHVRHERIAATGAWCRRDDGTVYLSNIAVRADLRRQGLARIMMLHLLDCCSEAAAVDLAVRPENEAACSLYRSPGFKRSRQVENFFGDGEPRLIIAGSIPSNMGM
jgi:ribosomal protein S18 acetylase RimI-like enzyme